MDIQVFEDRNSLGQAAALHAAELIRDAIGRRGSARIIAATGASQFEFLESLTKQPTINWRNVELFHLDEYLGVCMTHPASFCKYLQERLISKTGLQTVHFLDGAADPADVMLRVGAELTAAPIDVAFIGIGENGHIAFNDPPADFDTEEPYLIVPLDEMCRLQQVGEGWFQQLADVPVRAISMSVRQILKARTILAIVPGPRKAAAVEKCFNGVITPMAPASILRTHSDATIYLDQDSCALLSRDTLSASVKI